MLAKHKGVLLLYKVWVPKPNDLLFFTQKESWGECRQAKKTHIPITNRTLLENSFL